MLKSELHLWQLPHRVSAIVGCSGPQKKSSEAEPGFLPVSRMRVNYILSIHQDSLLQNPTNEFLLHRTCYSPFMLLRFSYKRPFIPPFIQGSSFCKVFVSLKSGKKHSKDALYKLTESEMQKLLRATAHFIYASLIHPLLPSSFTGCVGSLSPNQPSNPANLVVEDCCKEVPVKYILASLSLDLVQQFESHPPTPSTTRQETTNKN